MTKLIATNSFISREVSTW